MEENKKRDSGMNLKEACEELVRLEHEAGKQEIFFAENKKQYDWARGFGAGVGKALDLLQDCIWSGEEAAE